MAIDVTDASQGAATSTRVQTAFGSRGTLAWRYGFLVISAAIVCLLDQLTKYIVTITIGPASAAPGQEIIIVPGLLYLDYVQNTGMAFGLFRTFGNLFVPLVLAIMIVVLLYYRALRGRALLFRVALSLQMGGALGNLLDRLRLGYVVDFIAVPGFSVFNLADSAITVGAILLFLLMIFRSDAK